MYDIGSVLLLALILSAGIFIQSAAGFAGGLLIIPAMTWCGYQVPEAQCALLVAMIPQNVMGVWALRESIAIRTTVWPACGRLVFFPIGVGVLFWMDESLSIGARNLVPSRRWRAGGSSGPRVLRSSRLKKS